MTINDLKLNGISTLNDFEDFVKRKRLPGYFVSPEKITKLIESFCNSVGPKSAIILNSNYGEISSRLTHVPKTVSIEINANNVLIAKYLNQNCEFVNLDPLSYTSNIRFDFVVAFPPLGQRIEVNGRNVAVETLYIRKALSLLNEGGNAIFILQSSILSAPLYEEIRNHIQEHFGLSKIIKLPRGIISSIGIELTALVVSKEKIYKTCYYSLTDSIDFIRDKPDFIIELNDLSHRWDYNFHNPLNQRYESELNEHETKKIADLVDITFGVPFNESERQEAGLYRIIAPRNIVEGEIKDSHSDKFLAREVLNEREKKAVLRYGDILFPRFTRSHFSIYIHLKKEGQYIANQHMVILRGSNAEYVTTYLNTDSGSNIFNQQIARHSRGSTLPTISREDLENIRIPILPIENMELASKNKLQQLPYNELLDIKDKYEVLKSKYLSLKEKSNTNPHIEQLQGLENILNQVLINQTEHSQKLFQLENKIDDVKSLLLSMSIDFQDIKKMPRDIEEKINRLNKTLEEQLSHISFEQKQIDSYIKEIKVWFDYFDVLEPKSQKYIPEAEYIYDQISKLDNPDYSPFILQYCRALENELLTKIFRAYVQSIIDRKINYDKEFAWDLERLDTGKANDENTFRLSNHIRKCLNKKSDEWFFELGSMEVNLRYLTGRTIEKSPLLQDLKGFVLNQFNKELLNIEYLDEIRTIIKDYRNQSAHPNIMNTEKAIIFHKQMKECLINLMGNYKVYSH